MKLGTVYLIHFHRPIGNASNVRGQALHYMGWAWNLEDRLERHRVGRGSHLMRAVMQQGIGWDVVRTWNGDRSLERKLKNQKNASRLCPVCQGKL